MKKYIKFLLILALVFVLTPCFAAQKDYTVAKLKNGQTVVIKQVSTNPAVVIDTWIKTGSINEDDKNSGVAHFLEHLFFKGTEKNPAGTFDRILESKGAHTNAATSKDYTHYFITIPSKDFDLALSMHADMLLNPLVPRKELEKERSVVLEEISKTADSPTRAVWDNMFNLIYSPNKHPYFRPVIGKKEVIETITREEILDFYNKFYAPENMTTVIVGDVEPNEAIKKVEEYFATNEEKIAAKPVYPKISPIKSVLKTDEKMDVNRTYGAIAFSAPKFKNDKDGYALDVLATILGQSKSSKLNQILKEQKHLVYDVSASYAAFYDDGLFIIEFSCDPRNFDEVQKEIFLEISKIKKGEIEPNELNKAKNMIKTDTYYARESISNIASELGYMTTFWGSTSYYDNYLNNIQNVNKSDVVSVAKKYLKQNAYAISTVSPKDAEIKEISDIKPAGAVELKLLEQNADTKKYLLPNGAQLIIKNNVSNSIIAFDIAAKGSKILEKTPLTGSLAADCAKQGTKKYSNRELANLLDEKGIKLAFGAGQDVFSISMQTTENELNTALEILNEVVNYPEFSPSEIEKVKNLKEAALKKVEDDAMSMALDDFKKQIFCGTYYGQNAKFLLQNLPKISVDEIKQYYKNILNPQNMVISIVGDVDENKIATALNNIFPKKEGGKITLKNEKMNTFLPACDIVSKLKKPDTQTAWVVLGYKTSSLFNQKDAATLKVINAIMGEGMSSRLFKSLREEQGLAYVVGSSVSQNVLDGAYFAYIGTNNQSVEVAKNGMLTEILKLKSEYVSKKELQDAKEKILGNLVISLETNMDFASLNGFYAVTERPLNQLDEYKKLINQVSQADILEFANKYFSKPYICTIVSATD